MIYTTLNKIRAHDPCTGSWTKLLAALDKTQADDDPLAMTAILDICGLDDCLLAMRSLPEYGREWRLLSCDYAERVLPIFERERPDDRRPRQTIETARRYARGGATGDELAAARDAARAAAWAAARAAAGAAAGDAAWAAAGAAAGDAAVDAAWAAAGAAAGDAAWDAERSWQESRLREVLEQKGDR